MKDNSIPLSRFGLGPAGLFVGAAKFYDKFNWMFTSIIKLVKQKM